ncbi:MAG: hypothetical protein AB1391_03225 [Candidatus Micrarchaeota archaeon]
MASTIMNILRFIVALLIGAGITYFWMIIRTETDINLLAGIGIASTLISYALLYVFGKSGGGG